MRKLVARIDTRVSLDMAGRIAGLAGELECSESEAVRLVLERGLHGRSSAELIAELRAAREAELEDAIERAEERHGASIA